MSLADSPAILGGEPLCPPDTFLPFPRVLGNEQREVERALASENWLNGAITGRFERLLADYTGAKHAVAVNTGGMALQTAFRALGIQPGDEVLMPVDTCVADAFAVFNAGAVPIFADSNPETFGLDWRSVEETIGPRTKALVAVSMWGRPENMDTAVEAAQRHNLHLIDDACLACGAEWRGKKIGRFGRAGVFSFGALKPFQAGGGGVIITDDEDLAREMRASRAWGDLYDEFGVRDQKELAWNGRISEILAAVLIAQLEAYPRHLRTLQEGALRLESLIGSTPGIRLMDDDPRITAQAYTQFVFKVDEDMLGFSLDTFALALEAEGVPQVWHGAFEPIPSLSFFREGRWRVWTSGYPDPTRLHENYERPYPGAEHGFWHTGIGIGRTALCSGPEAIEKTAQAIERLCSSADSLRRWECERD